MFQLHERLAADTATIGDWPLCRVLLMNDARFPWLILVPRRAGIAGLHELDAADRHAAIDEAARASQALVGLHAPTRINVAALGNSVPQIHIHVIARFADDAAWPKPVWGLGQSEPYGDERAATLARLRDALAPFEAPGS